MATEPLTVLRINDVLVDPADVIVRARVDPLLLTDSCGSSRERLVAMIVAKEDMTQVRRVATQMWTTGISLGIGTDPYFVLIDSMKGASNHCRRWLHRGQAVIAGYQSSDEQQGLLALLPLLPGIDEHAMREIISSGYLSLAHGNAHTPEAQEVPAASNDVGTP